MRLVHDNSYGPCDNVDFRVRASTGPTAGEWVNLVQKQQRMMITRDEWIPRSKWKPGKKHPSGETPWESTHEAKLTLDAGPQTLEFEIISHDDMMETWIFTEPQIRVRQSR